MAMSKQHFEAIAKILRDSHPSHTWSKKTNTDREILLDQWGETLEHAVSSLSWQNPRFDADRFRLACAPINLR